MGDCVDTTVLTDFAARDVNRIVGKIATVLARKSPYVDILEGGTLENVSVDVRSVVQERAVMAASLAEPVFTDDDEMCQVQGAQDQVGSTEYSFTLQSLRGKGPRVCIKDGRTAFEGSYLQAQIALQKGILQIMNADVRAMLCRRSGVKFVAATGQPFDTLLTGDMQQIDTLFASGILPNAPISFKALYKLATFETEEMLAEPWESEQGSVAKFIGSQDVVEGLRQELDIKEDIRYLTAGKFTVGSESILGYRWMGPYRGITFGIDPQPLRFNVMSGDYPVFIEPEIGVATSNGVAARRNPAWVNAQYEICFLCFANSFKRLVPQKYTGEGTFRFDPQLAMGELVWRYIVDNDCNIFGDYGQHIYQISRAYQPIRPQNVIPIAVQRCQYDLGLNVCESSVTGL